MSLQIQSFVKENSQYSVDTPTFSWANMKPDFIPNLAKRKHYIEESFDFVVDKILSLLKLPSYNLLDKNKRKRIDVEMGIICHFLTDFFASLIIRDGNLSIT
ncbi:zinc dependent phospholipase C family protein [Cytobacillus pseudoceanisediminis]|uniref:zinc dependent phospholipase C family protein n=1 Tax=Cytobacillus pseudoceanisediminis TaxID=3051614 RepID=UPI003F713595